MDQYVKRFMDKGRVEGRAEERASAEEKDKRRVCNLYDMGMTPEKIAQSMELDLKLVKEWLAAPSLA